jgi:hypothetical protein
MAAAAEAFAGSRQAAATQIDTDTNDRMTSPAFMPDDREELGKSDNEKVVLIIEDDSHFAKVLMDLSRKKRL